MIKTLRKLMITTILICLIFKQTNQQKACEVCSKLQNSFFELISTNSEEVIKMVKGLCELGGTDDLCFYTVDNFARQLINHKFDFFNKTKYFCNMILETCDDDYTNFNPTRFRNKINNKFPKLVSHKVSDGVSLEEGQSFKAIVLNDVHIQNDYFYKSKIRCKDPGGCCSKIHGMPFDAEDQAGYWGTPNAFCDVPFYFLTKTLEHIQTTVDKVDFIFLLGDNGRHHFFREKESMLAEATEFIFTEVKRLFPDTIVIPVLGNHECHPVEYFDFKNKENFVYKNIINQFEHFVTQKEIEELKEKAFFKIEFPEQNLKVISVNSQIFDGFNIFLSNDDVYWIRFLNELGSELYTSEKKKQKVILLTHIPISDYQSVKQGGKALSIILERFRDTVIAFLSGHTHYDQVRFLRDEKNEIFMTNFISPSITTYTCHDPSFRIYEFENGKLFDFKQYAFDINKYNNLARVGDFSFEFELRYSFLERYELSSTDYDQIQILAKRLLSKEEKITEIYVNSYFCQTNLPDWGKHRDLVICELSDDVEEILRCIYKNSITPISEFGQYILSRRFLIGPEKIRKDSQSVLEE